MLQEFIAKKQYYYDSYYGIIELGNRELITHAQYMEPVETWWIHHATQVSTGKKIELNSHAHSQLIKIRYDEKCYCCSSEFNSIRDIVAKNVNNKTMFLCAKCHEKKETEAQVYLDEIKKYKAEIKQIWERVED